MIDAATRERLHAIRESGDLEGLASALLELSCSVPLFYRTMPTARDWIVESRELAAQCVADQALAPRQNRRHAELLLYLGQAGPAFMLARRAEAQATSVGELGLQDCARAIASRALVRLGRCEEALSLLEDTAHTQVHPLLDSPEAAGLSFLAAGEAYLQRGDFDHAIPLLMDALAHLSEGAAADRPRFDAHIALALAHHHCCDIEQVIRHVDSAQEITEQHDAWEGNAAVAFIRASIARARKESPEAWLQQVVTQAAVNAIPGDVHWRQPRFCIDRLYSMLNMRSLGEMAPRVEQQAARCSVEHDLVSYVFLAVLAAAIYDSHGTPDKGTELLARISQGLAAQKQGRAAATLDWFQEVLGV